MMFTVCEVKAIKRIKGVEKRYKGVLAIKDGCFWVMVVVNHKEPVIGCYRVTYKEFKEAYKDRVVRLSHRGLMFYYKPGEEEGYGYVALKDVQGQLEEVCHG